MFGINNKVLFVIGILITSVQMAFANINSTYLFETFSNEKVEKYWGIISVVSLISSSMGIFLSGYLWEINPSIMLLFSFLTTFLGFILTFKLPVKNDRM